MLIGYARVSKTDGSQSLDLQRDALRAAGVDDAVNLYHDLASGVRDDRPGLDRHRAGPVGPRAWACGCSSARGRRSTPRPRPAASCSASFAALAEFERELIRQRTVAGLKAARARGRKGGRKFALTKAQVRLAQAAMAHRDPSVFRAVPGARHQAGDALPVRRPAGPVAGAGPEGAAPCKSNTLMGHELVARPRT